MSKYNLSDILNEYIGGGRIGTLNISFKDLQDKMDELENSGKVIVRTLEGPSGDGKVNREFEVVDRDSAVPGGNKQERGFTVYDYKFGFDPGSEEHFMEEYPFSVGGNDLNLAMELIDGVEEFGIREEEMSKSDKNKLKKVSKQLKGAVKAHGNQAKAIDDVIDEMMEKPDYNQEEEEIIKMIKLMNPRVKEKFLKKLADMGKGKLDEEEGIGQLYVQPAVKKEVKFHLDAYEKGDIDVDDMIQAIEDIIFGRIPAPGMRENGHVDDYADEIEEGHAMSDNEADLESGVKGNMDAFTEESISESTQEESVAKYIMDYYRNPKTGESMISDEIVMEYFRTHKDWDQEGRWDGSKEGMEDGMDDFNEFFSANYDFDDGRLDEEDKNKKELPQSIKDKEARDAEIEAKKAKGMMKENMYLDHDEFMEEIVMDHFQKKGVSMNVVKDFLKARPEAIEMRGQDLDAEFESYMEVNSLNEVKKHFKRFMFKKYQ